MTQTIWLLLRILFQCTSISTTTQSNQSCSQAMLPFLQASDVELRLMSKALLAYCSTVTEDTLILKDPEVSRVIQMLNTDLTEPFSFHGLSFEALFSMIRQLAKVPRNTLLFVENAVPSILADLSERLLGDEQTAALELMWLLMQDDGETYIQASTTDPNCFTEPSSEEEQSLQHNAGPGM